MFGFVLRNLAIISAIAIIFFALDKMNEKQGQLPELYQEFQQLRQSGGDQARMQELYNEIMAIQSDTGYFKKLFRGYHWAIHDMAMKSLEQIKEISAKVESGEQKPLTREDKLAYKVGLYPFLKHINEKTPENAVILLPPGDSAMANNSKWNFIYEPEWTEYFIYPRLCLTTDREDRNGDLKNRITHVVIAEGRGYDKLKYEVPPQMRVREAVLPIDHPPAEWQQQMNAIDSSQQQVKKPQ